MPRGNNKDTLWTTPIITKEAKEIMAVLEKVVSGGVDNMSKDFDRLAGGLRDSLRDAVHLEKTFDHLDRATGGLLSKVKEFSKAMKELEGSKYHSLVLKTYAGWKAGMIGFVDPMKETLHLQQRIQETVKQTSVGYSESLKIINIINSARAGTGGLSSLDDSLQVYQSLSKEFKIVNMADESLVDSTTLLHTALGVSADEGARLGYMLRSLNVNNYDKAFERMSDQISWFSRHTNLATEEVVGLIDAASPLIKMFPKELEHDLVPQILSIGSAFKNVGLDAKDFVGQLKDLSNLSQGTNAFKSAMMTGGGVSFDDVITGKKMAEATANLTGSLRDMMSNMSDADAAIMSHHFGELYGMNAETVMRFRNMTNKEFDNFKADLKAGQESSKMFGETQRLLDEQLQGPLNALKGLWGEFKILLMNGAVVILSVLKPLFSLITGLNKLMMIVNKSVVATRVLGTGLVFLSAYAFTKTIMGVMALSFELGVLNKQLFLSTKGRLLKGMSEGIGGIGKWFTKGRLLKGMSEGIGGIGGIGKWFTKTLFGIATSAPVGSWYGKIASSLLNGIASPRTMVNGLRLTRLGIGVADVLEGLSGSLGLVGKSLFKFIGGIGKWFTKTLFGIATSAPVGSWYGKIASSLLNGIASPRTMVNGLRLTRLGIGVADVLEGLSGSLGLVGKSLFKFISGPVGWVIAIADLMGAGITENVFGGVIKGLKSVWGGLEFLGLGLWSIIKPLWHVVASVFGWIKGVLTVTRVLPGLHLLGKVVGGLLSLVGSVIGKVFEGLGNIFGWIGYGIDKISDAIKWFTPDTSNADKDVEITDKVLDDPMKALAESIWGNTEATKKNTDALKPDKFTDKALGLRSASKNGTDMGGLESIFKRNESLGLGGDELNSLKTLADNNRKFKEKGDKRYDPMLTEKLTSNTGMKALPGESTGQLTAKVVDTESGKVVRTADGGEIRLNDFMDKKADISTYKPPSSLKPVLPAKAESFWDKPWSAPLSYAEQFANSRRLSQQQEGRSDKPIQQEGRSDKLISPSAQIQDKPWSAPLSYAEQFANSRRLSQQQEGRSDKPIQQEGRSDKLISPSAQIQDTGWKTMSEEDKARELKNPNSLYSHAIKLLRNPFGPKEFRDRMNAYDDQQEMKRNDPRPEELKRLINVQSREGIPVEENAHDRSNYRASRAEEKKLELLKEMNRRQREYIYAPSLLSHPADNIVHCY